MYDAKDVVMALKVRPCQTEIRVGSRGDRGTTHRERTSWENERKRKESESPVG